MLLHILTIRTRTFIMTFEKIRQVIDALLGYITNIGWVKDMEAAAALTIEQFYRLDTCTKDEINRPADLLRAAYRAENSLIK
jgi:hypothetical protein